MKAIIFHIVMAFEAFRWVSCMDDVTKDLLTPWREYGEACGYESCPLTKKDMLNIHIVPNTHMEVGFSNNIDEHYTGEDEILGPRQRNAQKVLDAVITQLWASSIRRFSLSDAAFLFYWWANRDPTVRRMVYELVRQGRLFLVGGAMGMSDEAAVSYQGVIDHFTYALRKINATFLECGRPLVAWQADVLGHSREFASLMAQMGFDGLFVNPMSYDEEIARMRRQGLEFLWRGSDDLGQDSDIYTHKLFDGYWSPPGFCFSKLCSDPLLVTSDRAFRNLEERVDLFVESMLTRQAPSYGTKHVMVMMGHKFAFFDVAVWFANIEKLIDQVNKIGIEKRMNITAFYSSPPCYLQAVNEDDLSLETKQDDMFPIAYDKKTYIVGMYTSRPTIKYIVREAYVYLQIAKQLQVTADLGDNEKFFEYFMWIMSIVQDHGIITGAMRDNVMSYYVAKLHAYVQESTVLMSKAFTKLRNSSTHIHYARCMFNVSSCNETQYLKHSLQIYNPLGWPVSIPVRLPCIIQNTKFNVYDHKGKKVKSVTMRTAKPILTLKGRTQTDREVVFIAEDIPPIGFRSYFVEADWYAGGERKKRSVIKNAKENNIKKHILRQINPLQMDEDLNPAKNEKKLEEFPDYDLYDEPPFPINASIFWKKPVGTGDTDYEYEVLKFTPPDDQIDMLKYVTDINNTKIPDITRDPNLPKRTTAIPEMPIVTTIKPNVRTTSTATTTTTTRSSNIEPIIIPTKNTIDLLIPNARFNIPIRTTTKATTTTESTFGIEETTTKLADNINEDIPAEVTTESTSDVTTETTKEETTEMADIENKVTINVDKDEKETAKTATKLDDTVTTEGIDEVTTVLDEEVTIEEVTTEETTEGKTPEVNTDKPRSGYVPTVIKGDNYRKYFDVDSGDNVFIGNKYVRLNLDQNNHVSSIYLCNGVNISLDIQLYYYVSDDPKKLEHEDDRAPGIFTFRPMDSIITSLEGKKYNVEVIKNDIVEELHIQFNEWAFLIIRLYANSPVIEVNWLIGPIPIEDDLGKDVFIKYATDLENEGVFYTDSNGRQTLKRIRNRRAYYEPASIAELGGNLYPVTSKLYIEDLQKNIRFTVFNDRCQAGSSFKEGTVDFLIHRRILTDDVGITLTLNETEFGEGLRVLGTHYLYLTKANFKKNKIFEKKFAKEVEMPPKVLVSYRRDYKPKIMKEEFYRSNNEFSALNAKLPIGVHLLTLQKWSEKLLIRIENYLEKADALNTGIKVVDLKNLFRNITIIKIKETMLAANMYKEDWAPKHWTKKGKFFKNFNENYGTEGEYTYEEDYEPDEEDSLETGIKLKPQQIRTFIAEFEYKKK